MPHPHIDVRYVANLARLALGEEEIRTFEGQLNAVLEHVATLAQADVSGGGPDTDPAPIFGRMRDDQAEPSLPLEAVLQNAPDQAQGQFRVPKVVADA